MPLNRRQGTPAHIHTENTGEPKDHQAAAPAEPIDGGDDELLADMPTLKNPARLRIGESNQILKLMMRVRSVIPTPEHDYPAMGDEELAVLARERDLEFTDGAAREELLALHAEFDKDGQVDLDLDDMSDEDFDKLVDMLESVDKFAESIAVNRAAYILWSEGKGIGEMMAILNRYSSAVGESDSSAR